VLLKNGSNSSGAEAFFQYLASPRAAEVFRKFGFVVPSQPGG